MRLFKKFQAIVGNKENHHQGTVYDNYFPAVLYVFPPKHRPWLKQSDDQKYGAGYSEEKNEQSHIVHHGLKV